MKHVCNIIIIIIIIIITDLSIDALQYKVFPGTESSVFHDRFFQAQNIVVNALDNVEARRYVDRWALLGGVICIW